jgi:serine/threonine-protein phosphatase 2A regulatory subunit A
VLVTVAEVLPFLVDMVGDCEPAGTPGGKAAILNLLGDLCHQEETTVRDQAAASLNKIAESLSAKDVQALFVPIALKLARNAEWFTPRVSACGLFALSFKAVADDASAAALRGELRETFKALGIDDAPMVRRSTAGRLAEFAEVLSESMVIEDLLPLYFTLCTDEQDSVPMRPKRPNPPGPRAHHTGRRGADPAPPAATTGARERAQVHGGAVQEGAAAGQD